MNGRAFYNENDPFCAEWLRRLIASGLIADGDVIERDIRDVRPAELRGYRQVHLFAGIGIWSGALREAGVRDDQPRWTISCPCQPFSAAGKGNGFADERHLWPAAFHLVEQCRPSRIYGEQVASPDGLLWLDLVQDDMEGAGYAFGAVDTCAAGACVDFADSEEGRATIEWIQRAVLHCPDPFLASELSNFAAWAGANLGYGPAHIRQRLYWVADAECSRWERGRTGEAGRRAALSAVERSCDAGGVAHSADARSFPGAQPGIHRGEESPRPRDAEPERSGSTRVVAHADERQRGRFADSEGRERDREAPGRQQGNGVAESGGDAERGNGADQLASGPSGLAGTDWIICTDGKARPTQPGILPLAHDWKGPSRVAVLRAAGNSLVKAQAVQFIEAAEEAMRDAA